MAKQLVMDQPEVDGEQPGPDLSLPVEETSETTTATPALSATATVPVCTA